MEENAPPKPKAISDLSDIPLIVKSANQQLEDLIVHSQPSWTVRRLKMHLYQVHPSNPTVPEQKLIYSGQLLSDELTLKDVLRSYKDVNTENHIFHLVYPLRNSAIKTKLQEPQPLLSNTKKEQKIEAPNPQVVTPASNASDGLRRRNVGLLATSSLSGTTPTSAPSSAELPSSSSSVPTTSKVKQESAPSTTAANVFQQQIPNIPFPFVIPQVPTTAELSNNFVNVTPIKFPGQSNNNSVAEQEAAMQKWVQQIYNNYIEQCLKLAQITMSAAQMQSSAPSIPMWIPIPQFMPPNFPTQQTSIPIVATAASVTTAAAKSVSSADTEKPGTSQAARATFAPRVIPVIPSAAQQPQPAASNAGVPVSNAVPPSTETATSPAAAPAPAPAENVEQPPPQPRFPNIVQEEQDNRDWLDSFYSVTRLLALLTLVYFYSSPLRCLAVGIIAFGIYLYNTGFFQTRRPVQPNNRNINNNQNINDNNAAPAGDNTQTQESPQESTEVNQSTAGESETLISSVTPPENETSSTSLIAFVRTFVVSFFASLLPETPAL